MRGIALVLLNYQVGTALAKCSLHVGGVLGTNFKKASRVTLSGGKLVVREIT